MQTLKYDLSKLSPELRSAAEGEFRHLFTQFPDKLLGIDTNAKTVKGEKKGFITAILYMAPANMSGENLCPLAYVAQCDAACLFTAGRGGFQVNIMSRLRKALYWQQHRGLFLAQLHKEIAAASRKADKLGYTLLVRLNGTTDIRWESYGVPQAHPGTQFYDYTKIPNRRNVPANYDLTYSYSGVKAYQPFVKRAIESGMRIAVVFRTRAAVESYLTTGEKFMGLDVVDGDDSDVRHIDPMGAVVALYAKGAAKKDRTGFVVG